MSSLKCQQCAGVLLGATVICKQCGYNNALQRRNPANPLAQKTLTPPATVTPSQTNGTESASLNLAPLAARVRARYAPATEANLLQFPVTAVAQAPAESAEKPAAPDWREKTRARVRQHIGQTDEEQTAETATASLSTNPNLDPTAQLLVESALKRIRRANLPQPATEKLRERRAALKGDPVALAALDEPVIVRAPQRQNRLFAQQAESASSTYANLTVEANSTATLHQSRYENGKVQLHAQSPNSRFVGYESHNASNLALQPEFLPELQEELPELQTELTVAPVVAQPEQVETQAVAALPITSSSIAEHEGTFAFARHLDVAEQSETVANRYETVITPLAQASESLHEMANLTNADQAEGYVATEEELAPIRWKGQPAPLWLRTLAGICDLEFITLVFAPFFGVYFTLDNELDLLDYYTLTAMFVLVTFLYQLITYYFNGRTFGMVLFGLRNVDVVDASRYVSFSRRFKQALGGTVSLLCPPFNFLVTRVTGYQRGFGDALGQTLTLRKLQE